MSLAARSFCPTVVPKRASHASSIPGVDVFADQLLPLLGRSCYGWSACRAYTKLSAADLDRAHAVLCVTHAPVAAPLPSGRRAAGGTLTSDSRPSGRRSQCEARNARPHKAALADKFSRGGLVEAFC